MTRAKPPICTPTQVGVVAGFAAMAETQLQSRLLTLRYEVQHDRGPARAVAQAIVNLHKAQRSHQYPETGAVYVHALSVTIL